MFARMLERASTLHNLFRPFSSSLGNFDATVPSWTRSTPVCDKFDPCKLYGCNVIGIHLMMYTV